MPEPFVFDSRCIICKDPYGAVTCGTNITFHCRPLLKENFGHCALILQREFSGIEEFHEMNLDGLDGDRARFSLVWTAPEEPDLIWYYFRFWRDDFEGSGCELDRTGYRSDPCTAPWQLTVYQENQTPDWFQNGIVYQIFPDRFCRLPKNKDFFDSTNLDRLPGNRWIHENWSDIPEWRPDADGEVRNRDFFGGTLRGIRSKLDYLQELGVSILYLCPIFESASNHRYNTGDYKKIDPMLGTEFDFQELCQEAKKRGIRVILDGVFNHTGSQSLYFNIDGFYPTLGAAQSQDSPYYHWFSFHPWPDSYDSWWGIQTLPAVQESSPDYIDYIIENPDSVIRHWLRCGASGWRLDVADELPDCFIEKIRVVMNEEKPDAFLLGEVWEDASNKISYSQRRKYLLGHELHGVMNYPFRTALLDYLRGGDADDFREIMENIRENYPADAFYSALNFLGTHDTSRILTMLGTDSVPERKDDRAYFRLSPAERQKGEAFSRLAALILFTFPGTPMIYYGDELALEGCEDPFNRGTMPWDFYNQNQNNYQAMHQFYAQLGMLRRKFLALRQGALHWLYTSGPLLVFSRESQDSQEISSECLITAVNAGTDTRTLTIPWNAKISKNPMNLLAPEFCTAENKNFECKFDPEHRMLSLTLAPETGILIK